MYVAGRHSLVWIVSLLKYSAVLLGRPLRVNLVDVVASQTHENVQTADILPQEKSCFSYCGVCVRVRMCICMCVSIGSVVAIICGAVTVATVCMCVQYSTM